MTITNENRIALLALLFPIFALSQEFKIDSLFDHLNSNTPGITITVVQNEKVIYSKGHGMANLSYSIPLTDTSLLDIGSCAKTFTAYAILLLQSEGKLLLDDQITKYLPEFPAYGDSITIRHLGTHTSGIREWIRLFQLSGYQLDGDPTLNDHLLKLIYRQEDINFDPGTRFNYSNSNYVLLAEIVEKVSGQRFSSFMRDRIFLPLGMSNTFFYDDLYTIKHNEAVRYFKRDSTYWQIPHYNPAAGAGGLYTTSKDMSKWVIHINNELHRMDMAAELTNQMILKSGDTISATFGLYSDPHNGYKQWQHEGGGVGINSYIGFFPDQNLSIFVSCNDAECYPQYYALEIIDLLLQKKNLVNDKLEKTLNFDGVGAVQVNEWAGDYWSDDAFISRSIHFRNDTMFYSRSNGSEDELVSLEPGYYTFKGSAGTGIKIWFRKDPHGQKNMYYQLQNDPPIRFIEYIPFKLKSSELAQFEGTFYSTELESVYAIEHIDGLLYATHLRLEPVKLEQVMADVFTGSKTSFGQVMFTRNNLGKVNGFVVSSRNAKGIRFERINN